MLGKSDSTLQNMVGRGAQRVLPASRPAHRPGRRAQTERLRRRITDTEARRTTPCSQRSKGALTSRAA
jgi:hypothetical protein